MPDRIEFAAVTDLWRAAPAWAAKRLGLIEEAYGSYRTLGCRALAGVSMLNRVLGAGLAPAVDEEALSRAAMALNDAGCLACVPLSVDGPSSQQTGRWLGEHGFAPGYAWMKFAVTEIDGAPAPRAGVRTRVIRTADATVFGGLLADGFALPAAFGAMAAELVGREGWTCLIADVDGEPAGCGAAFVDGDVAWLGLAATRPGARGRGVQGSLLAARLRAASEAGCRIAITETGERVPDRPAISYRNILRAGFAEIGLRPSFVRDPAD